jgi:hypothetical protein
VWAGQGEKPRNLNFAAQRRADLAVSRADNNRRQKAVMCGREAGFMKRKMERSGFNR